MVHPFDSEAWKHFNRVHPQFSMESMNVFLGLCLDRFNSFRSFFAPYSCWMVILIIYNMSPRMCMRLKFMFLSTIIPGSNSPSQNIDIFFCPLIDELK